MPGVVRDAGRDIAGGSLIRGSNNVFVNGKPLVRRGDQVAAHGRGIHSGPVMAVGSDNVFTNNIPTCRAGDIATCGHPAVGSYNVFAND